MKLSGGPMLLIKKLLLTFLSVSLIVCIFRAYSFSNIYDDYIEVCSSGLAYVPLFTKYVKCHGVIYLVQKIDYNITEEEISCECPNCPKECDGWCWIESYGDPGNEIQFIWVKCPETKNK
jgi:hypothetical protein